MERSRGAVRAVPVAPRSSPFDDAVAYRAVRRSYLQVPRCGLPRNPCRPL
jgi:hypothetical protein